MLELGCSQGVNSLLPVKTILEVLAGRAAAEKLEGRLEVVVCHDDLPSNDFHALLLMLEDPQQTYVPQVTAATRRQRCDLVEDRCGVEVRCCMRCMATAAVVP